ncbi:ferrochelatase [Georgenia sp. Z1491]|uniref:ferrochelatase n=1 Tax=Georgenia sp. Z1491 TaxID=3416707 RepID=UPI003CE80B6B
MTTGRPTTGEQDPPRGQDAPGGSARTAPPVTAGALAPYDAVLLMSFGGPERPEDVVPFLRRVTAGRGIPDERLEEVGEHYYAFGGRSPINDLNRDLLAALRTETAARGIDVPVVWGNRNWDPDGIDVLRELYDAGARRVAMVATSAYGSYSSCRQYRQDVGRYVPALVAEGRPLVVDKVRPYFNDPGFVSANADAVEESMRALGGEPHLMFVTHSIPTTMEVASGRRTTATYAEQHEEVARLVSAEVGRRLGRELDWSLTYCSRSGDPRTPWLEPDVNDALRDLATTGRGSVVLSPIGFVSDHMEVVYDLDTEAAETAEELGLRLARAATAGTYAQFVAGLADLLLDRAAEARGVPAGAEGRRAVVGDLPAWESACAVACCAVRDGVDDGRLALCGQPDDVVTAIEESA